jgi:hypothetical protein
MIAAPADTPARVEEDWRAELELAIREGNIKSARAAIVNRKRDKVREYCEMHGLLAKVVQKAEQEEGLVLVLSRFLVDDCGVSVDGDDNRSSALSWCALPQVMDMRTSVARFLCDQGADPMKPNHIGPYRTCYTPNTNSCISSPCSLQAQLLASWLASMAPLTCYARCSPRARTLRDL